MISSARVIQDASESDRVRCICSDDAQTNVRGAERECNHQENYNGERHGLRIACSCGFRSWLVTVTAIIGASSPLSTAPQSVWWTAKLHLDNLASIPERLGAPFEDNLVVYKGEETAT